MKKTKEKTVGKPTLSSYLKREKFWISGYIITEVIGNLFSVVATLVIAKCLTALTEALYIEGVKYILMYGAIRVVRRICYWIGCKMIFESSTRLSFRIRNDLIDRTFKLKSKTFSDSSSGLFVTRVVEDSNETFSKINEIIEAFASLFSGLITTIYIATLNIWVGVIFVVSIILLSFFETYRKKIGTKLKRKAKYAKEEVVAITTEIVRSEKDIKALNLEDKLRGLTSNKFETLKSRDYKRDMVDAHLWNTRTLIVDLVIVAVILLSINQVSNGLMTVASLLFVFMNKDMFYDLIWYIGHISKKITECKVCCSRMFEIFDEEKFPSESFGNIQLEKCDGEIEFKDVCFSYEDSFSKEEEEPNFDLTYKQEQELKRKKPVDYIKVFENLSFKIPANKTVAFVGKSGSGKSTILSLMSKMYEADSGEVLIDGKNINDLNENSIRDNISLVNQFPYIFNTTIKKNLLMAKKDATDEQILDACKRAAFLPFVQGLKNGLDTKVGEGGIKLSGGQKQRLAIARALLRKSKIILFDESTSSLDNFAQEEIKESIHKLSGGNTVVIVAHRLSTIKNADKIYFLDSGKICGEGTFEKLYKDNELFRKMFQTENV